VKNGTVAQDFSAAPSFTDYPNSDVSYQLMARCTSNPACSTVTGASTSAKVYPGDSSDIALSVSFDRTTGLTTLRFPSRPQPVTVSGYDVFNGSQADDGSSTTPTVPDVTLASLATLSCNVGIGVPVGTDVVVTSSAAQPLPNAMQYYLVGHSSPVAGSKDGLGKGANGNTRISPISCP